jgi:hypothetical protein
VVDKETRGQGEKDQEDVVLDVELKNLFLVFGKSLDKVLILFNAAIRTLHVVD